MPKAKNAALDCRFKITGNGKLKRFKANKSHILTKKTTKRKKNAEKAQHDRKKQREGHEENPALQLIAATGFWVYHHSI